MAQVSFEEAFQSPNSKIGEKLNLRRIAQVDERVMEELEGEGEPVVGEFLLEDVAILRR